MLTIKPFKGIHPKEEYIRDFVLHPSNSFKGDIENRQKVDSIGNIFNSISGEETLNITQEYPQDNFKKARAVIDGYVENTILSKNNTATLYIYEQSTPEHTFRGLVGLVPMESFRDGSIKGHKTISNTRATFFKDFYKGARIQTDPIVLTYDATMAKLDVLMGIEVKSKAFIDYEDEYGTRHRLWKVENRLKISEFKSTIEKIGTLYITDGHHRLEGKLNYSDEIIKTEGEDSIIFDLGHQSLSLIVPNDYLKIYEYNRLLKSINGLSKEGFLSKLEENFIVTPKGASPYYSSHKHHMSMYIDGEFYGLYIKNELRTESEETNFDVYSFDKLLLEPILGITESRKNDNVVIIKGTGNIEGIKDIKEKVDSKEFEVGFGFYRLSAEDIKQISDCNINMPTKTAYIEPRTLNGLVIVDLD